MERDYFPIIISLVRQVPRRLSMRPERLWTWRYSSDCTWIYFQINKILRKIRLWISFPAGLTSQFFVWRALFWLSVRKAFVYAATLWHWTDKWPFQRYSRGIYSLLDATIPAIAGTCRFNLIPSITIRQHSALFLIMKPAGLRNNNKIKEKFIMWDT